MIALGPCTANSIHLLGDMHILKGGCGNNMRHAWRLQRIHTGHMPRVRLLSSLSARKPGYQKPCRSHILFCSPLSFLPFVRPPTGAVPSCRGGLPGPRSYSTSDDAFPPSREQIYVPEVDLEDSEDYKNGGYHPTIIGETFHNGRYEVVHKLGFGGYSTVWLARDKYLQRYVSLKILVAHESPKSNEACILRLFSSRGGSTHQGQQFIPLLLDQFSFDGPNGRHTCLVQESAGCSIAASKEDSTNFLFPVETARSIAAQLIMGVAYLHSRGVCHGGILTQPPSLAFHLL